MEIRDLPRLRQGAELLIVKMQRLLDQSNHAEIPFVGIEARRWAIAENGKFVGEVLSGWWNAMAHLARRQDFLHTVGNYYWSARKGKSTALSGWMLTAMYRVSKF
jgi:hypothetical protein